MLPDRLAEKNDERGCNARRLEHYADVRGGRINLVRDLLIVLGITSRRSKRLIRSSLTSAGSRGPLRCSTNLTG
jgi:hypothetical protein